MASSTTTMNQLLSSDLHARVQALLEKPSMTTLRADVAAHGHARVHQQLARRPDDAHLQAMDLWFHSRELPATEPPPPPPKKLSREARVRNDARLEPSSRESMEDMERVVKYIAAIPQQQALETRRMMRAVYARPTLPTQREPR